MCLRYILYSSFLSGLFAQSYVNLEAGLGDTCVFDEERNTLGTCKLRTECYYAQTLVQTNRPPPLCRDSSIVCCPLVDDSVFFDAYFEGTSRNVISNSEMTCTYNGRLPMICCPKMDKKEEEKREEISNRFGPQCSSSGIQKPKFQDAVQEVIWKKCVEYYEYTRICTYDKDDPNKTTEVCHIQYNPDKIIGGDPAVPNEFPHMAVIGSSSRKSDESKEIVWVGGGSLISRKYILTAAHILVNQRGKVRFALLGTLDKTDVNQGELFTIVRLIPHEGYAYPRHYYDIGLVELNRPVALSEFIRPICLPAPGIEHDKKKIVAGWGLTWNNASAASSNVLLKVYVDEKQLQDCKDAFSEQKNFKWNHTSMMCAIGKQVRGSEVYKDSCQGDSGGPLVSTMNMKGMYCNYVINGIVSWSQGCGFYTPAAYTRVEAYLRWIVERVWPRELTALEKNACEPIQKQLPTPKKGQKAWNKCLEYQQLVYPCTGSIRKDFCRHNDSMEVGSSDAAQDEFPHMALVGNSDDYENTFKCAGSIISDRFILTSAQCARQKDYEAEFVLVGTLDKTDRDNDKMYTIKSVILHPDYRPQSPYNNIALLKTSKPIKLGPSVVPACLDTGNHGTSTTEVLGTGWGATTMGGPLFNTLQKVKLTKFNDMDCIDYFQTSNRLSNGVARTQSCYHPTEQNKDMCQGNSGSPIQVKSTIKCMYTVVGLVSGGGRCGVVGIPSIYTRVNKYLTWIESVVWP